MDVTNLRDTPPIAYMILVIILVIGIFIWLSGKMTDDVRNILIVVALALFLLLSWTGKRLIGMSKAKTIAHDQTKVLQRLGEVETGRVERVQDGILRRDPLKHTPLYYEVAAYVENDELPYIVFALEPYTGDVEQVRKDTSYSSSDPPIDARAGTMISSIDLLFALKSYQESQTQQKK